MKLQKYLPIIVAMLSIPWASAAEPEIQDYKTMVCRSVSNRTCDLYFKLGRGVNLGGMLDAPKEGQWGVKYDSRFPDAIASKFNHVRLPVNWSNHAAVDESAKVDETFARRVDMIINALLDKNLYVIVNVHGYSQLYGDKVTYGEQTVSDDVLEKRFINIWKQLSSRYKNYSDRLVFEILNEPHGKVINSDHWNELLSESLKTIRTDNPSRVVMFGPTYYNSQRDLPKLKVPNDQNLIIQIHSYEPFFFSHQGVTYLPMQMPIGVKCCDDKQTQIIHNELNQAYKWSQTYGYPVYLGEFGTYKAADIESRANFARIMKSKAEDLKIPWGYWDFASSAFGFYDAKTGDWNQPIIDALMH